MVIDGIPTDQRLHIQAAQDLLNRGRKEGDAILALRQLNRRCDSLGDVSAHIQLLLDFKGQYNLAAWLAANAG